ncbi:hypothetical protein [Bdellovibrio sp. HCB-110]|uniref:hypothetical protein n=1 Tax=Bdellovibrio sp. HCB-110 TaxID=3391182 RepID=UPI0039B6311F
MWNKRVALGLLVLALSVKAWAKKEVVYFGGGGEPAGPSTIFDAAYANFAPFSAGSGWTARSYFDGGHANSEAIAQQKFKGKSKPMTAKNMADEIASLKARINNGSLAKGDQVMVTIATHGLEPKKPQSTHSITTTDQSFNMDELAQLRDLAEKKGVSLAIVDLSCYSGNSLKLGTDKTCVISASAGGVSYNTSGDFIGRNMKKGLTLEEAFLDGRSHPTAAVPAAPQISSEAGRKAYELTKILSESMQERSLIKSTKEMGAYCYGTKSNPYAKLVSALRDIGNSSEIFSYLKVKFGIEKSQMEPLVQKLEAAMKKYENSRRGVQKTFDEITGLEKQECHAVASMKLCGNKANWAFGYKLLKEREIKGQLDEKGRAELAVYRSYVNTPGFRKWESLKAAHGTQDGLFDEAKEVARVEREVYQVLYEELSKKSSKPNPCRSFVL